MAKPKSKRSVPAGPTPFEQARDELFQHIRGRLAALGNPQESETAYDSTGMNPDDRSDDDDPADHVDDEEPEEDGGP